MRRPGRSSLSCVLAAACLVTLHSLLLGRFFPHANGMLGNDYSYFLPELLDGFFWYTKNGAFAVPWFTPSFCAGIPKFANPQALYYSIPQLATILTDPLTGLKLTLFAFAAAGFWGFYLLARRSFGASRSTALLGGTLFLFNGFFASRMLIGHLAFHSFMLSPLLFHLLLRPGDFDSSDSRWRFWLDVVCAAFLLAYIAMTALPTLLFQTLLAAIAVAALLKVYRPEGLALPGFAAKLSLSGGIALGIAAAKLTAMLYFHAHFPRTFYPLPGVPSLVELLALLGRGLFLDLSHVNPGRSVVNSRVLLGSHEFDFGIGPVPLGLLLGGAALAVSRLADRELRSRIRTPQWAALAVLLLCLTLPLALNYYSPGWNAFLKSLPLIASSSTAIRWFSVYIPVLILMALLAIERAPVPRRLRSAIAWLAIAAAVALDVGADRFHPAFQGYDPRPVLEAFGETRAGRSSPVIERVGISLDPNGREQMLFYGDTSLVQGTTPLLCYETLFGYHLETFPRGTTHAGRVFPEDGNFINIKNPSCFLYPEVNGCRPGDDFAADQRAAAKAFAAYTGFPFEMPVGQKLANATSLAALAGSVLFLGAFCLRRPGR